MPLLYSSISRGHVILVDKTLGPNDCQSVARELLYDVSVDSNRKTSFPRDECLYHTITDGGLVYLCVAEREAGRRMPYMFLDELKNEFGSSASLVQRATNAGTFEFNREFRQNMGDLMDKFNSGKGDHLVQLQNQVGEVTGIMKQNVEKVLERGEKLDDLVDKTEDLQASGHSGKLNLNNMTNDCFDSISSISNTLLAEATTFQATSRKISRKMFWRNKRMTIIIVVVVLVLILIITLVILSSTGTI